jgi:hypothetical protein
MSRREGREEGQGAPQGSEEAEREAATPKSGRRRRRVKMNRKVWRIDGV